jgi:hypothetical protein
MKKPKASKSAAQTSVAEFNGYVVAIGASADGLDALERFFDDSQCCHPTSVSRPQEHDGQYVLSSLTRSSDLFPNNLATDPLVSSSLGLDQGAVAINDPVASCLHKIPSQQSWLVARLLGIPRAKGGLSFSKLAEAVHSPSPARE